MGRTDHSYAGNSDAEFALSSIIAYEVNKDHLSTDEFNAVLAEWQNSPKRDDYARAVLNKSVRFWRVEGKHNGIIVTLLGNVLVCLGDAKKALPLVEGLIHG